MDDKNNKWDVKQIGAGAGGIVGLLFLFQSQGIELMNKKQEARNEAFIERAISNSDRIGRLENTVTRLESKLERGFDSVRKQMSNETNRLSDLIRESSNDRWTKSEHSEYKQGVQKQIDHNEQEINYLKDIIRKQDFKPYKGDR